MNMVLAQFAVGLFAVFRFSRIVNPGVVLREGISCRRISAVAVNIHAASSMLISKAKWDE
jgi:hypothetical protein